MGLPPTSFITDKDPGAEWSREDKKLAMAWTILQHETCKKCGQPLWICRSSERNLQFKIKRDICYATAELEKPANKKKAENLKPGEYQYVIPYTLDESPLPSRRSYLESLNED